MLVERDQHWEPRPFGQIEAVGHRTQPDKPQPEAGALAGSRPLDDIVMRSDGEIISSTAGKPGSVAPLMLCPECEEPAISHPATDLVPWQAHGLERPQWSHADGSALCPVIGLSGAYEPAQPQPADHGPKPDSVSTRPDPAITAEANWAATSEEPEIEPG